MSNFLAIWYRTLHLQYVWKSELIFFQYNKTWKSTSCLNYVRIISLLPTVSVLRDCFVIFSIWWVYIEIHYILIRLTNALPVDYSWLKPFFNFEFSNNCLSNLTLLMAHNYINYIFISYFIHFYQVTLLNIFLELSLNIKQKSMSFAFTVYNLLRIIRKCWIQSILRNLHTRMVCIRWCSCHRSILLPTIH